MIMRLSQNLLCGRTRGNGHNLKYRIFHVEEGKNPTLLPYLKGALTLEQVAKKDCEISILEDVQTQLDMVLGILPQFTLLRA